jgi:hypothetical protein
LAKTTLAFAVLALQQVASPLFPTKNFPCPSDFETLGNGFPCFCFSSDSWHGTGKLGIRFFLARGKWDIFMAISSCYPQGRHENGKWMRKQFSGRTEAETFAALKSVIEESAVAMRTIASC